MINVGLDIDACNPKVIFFLKANACIDLSTISLSPICPFGWTISSRKEWGRKKKSSDADYTSDVDAKQFMVRTQLLSGRVEFAAIDIDVHWFLGIRENNVCVVCKPYTLEL